jgi:hypothetical protein
MGFEQPPLRIAPDARSVLGDDEVEAGPIERHLFGVGMDEREREAELLLEPIHRLQLAPTEVDADRPKAPPREPRRNGRGSATQLDDVRARLEVMEKLEI